MKTYPSIPDVADAPERLFAEGHLWVTEKVDGAQFRFQLQESGRVRFGDRTRVYDHPDAVPEPYQHAVRHVQTHLDRETLRAAVDDVEEVVFFAVAMHFQTIDYEWERTPSVLGVDIWSGSADAFRPPDAVVAIFDRLGLQAVPVVDRELRARDFDPGSYRVPQSAWCDGPAEGVVIRNKRGGRAQLTHPDRSATADRPHSIDASAPELATTYATHSRLETLATTLDADGSPVTVERLYERLLETIGREAPTLLTDDGPVDSGTFRSEIAARTRSFLDDREPSSQATR